MSRYPFATIEKKWQEYWQVHDTFRIEEDSSFSREKRLYLLDMFPYPSGDGLHVGHPEGYTATDILCRYLRMHRFNVLHPMGFDCFGLPAENYAIATGTHPRVTTEKNIARFRQQIQALGFSYDWSREIATHKPEYYRWTQWIFLQLFKKGLVYETEAPINWCPSCLTGLANEEVQDGRCDRCGEKVERKHLRQCMLRITAYAERLLEDLEGLDWPDSIKTMQRHWIGRSTGANIIFSTEKTLETIEVYTTRPDTLFGVTFMVLAPEHPLVGKLTDPSLGSAVTEYKQRTLARSDLERTDLAKEKSGLFLGSYAIHPVTKAKIPIWISDYVLMTYGTGAIMAVPGHDQRDWEFATRYHLPIISVLESDIPPSEGAFVGEGVHINSCFLDDLGKDEAIEKMISWLEAEGKGRGCINYRLRDWIFSRQRYWGEPIPLVHCPQCGIVPLPEDALPVVLPEVEKYTPTGTGQSPLAKMEEWLSCSCPSCGGPGKRETNTMPQWAGSCWYYLRYLDPYNETSPFSPEKEAYWMPVDLYVGGAEHAVLHLLYARFWHKVLYDLGIVKDKEPFQRLVNQGMITSFAYQKEGGGLLAHHQVREVAPGEFVSKKDGKPVRQIVAKMSKSLRNVINPDEIIRDYGADSMRIYEMFMGPLKASKPWSTQGLSGVNRFLNRVWTISEKPLTDAPPPQEILRELHKTIKKVSLDTHSLEFNTAISQMMILTNLLFKDSQCYRAVWRAFVLILSPYAPHLCEEMWFKLGYTESLAFEAFPTWDESLLRKESVTIVVQVNGKVRAKMSLPPGSSEATLSERALQLPSIQKWVQGKEPRRIVILPDRLVNIVLP